jgi:hypothetical protein
MALMRAYTVATNDHTNQHKTRYYDCYQAVAKSVCERVPSRRENKRKLQQGISESTNCTSPWQLTYLVVEEAGRGIYVNLTWFMGHGRGSPGFECLSCNTTETTYHGQRPNWKNGYAND